MQIKRRDFIRLVGGISGVALIGGLSLDDVIEVPDDLVEAARRGPGIETWKNTVCRQCPGGCGISVRLVDGIPVSIKGNPLFPVNQGGMCPLGFGGLEVLYNPDRVRQPLRRVGLHGSGRWEPITWDEGLDTVNGRLAELRQQGRAYEVAFLSGNVSRIMDDHIGRFMEAYGSPNHYRLAPFVHDAVPYLLTQGVSALPAYDLLNTKYVLALGANYLEEGTSPVYYTKLYSKLRESTEGRRTQFVCVDSRLNLTAANADHWIPIRPGTYGALALGLAYVLIREEMYDAQFVANHTFGFEDGIDTDGRTRLGFRSVVLGGYYPERVEEITGVPAQTILELGRDLGIVRPSIVIGGAGAADQVTGTYALTAIHSLNALLGNFEKAGGVMTAPDAPLSPREEVNRDSAAEGSLAKEPIAASREPAYPLSPFSIDSFTENVLAGQPYPVSLLFVYGGNPLFSTLNHHRLTEALKRIPLIVSFDPFVNETSEYADIVLPDHTFLEKWDAVCGTPSVIFAHVGLQQPVVEPFHDTRHTGDVLTSIAQSIGGTVAGAFTHERFEDVVRSRMQGIFESGEGAVVSEGVQQSWLEFLQQRGWQIGRYSSFEEFWRLLADKGGWWNPVRRETDLTRLFRTPSSRFEFYSQILRDAVQSLSTTGGSGQEMERVLTGLMISARGDLVYLPHHEQPGDLDDGWPLYLTTFQTLANRDGDASNQPLMQEMFGYSVWKYWRTWAEIHPETASAYGVHDGDWIWVESAVGSIRVEAVVHPGIQPHVVAVPFGLGHTSYGRYAAGHGANPNSIMRKTFDRISGRPALQSTRVRISRVT